MVKYTREKSLNHACEYHHIESKIDLSLETSFSRFGGFRFYFFLIFCQKLKSVGLSKTVVE